MIWNNMRDNPPPKGELILVGIQDEYYLGRLDNFNVFQPVGGSFKGIPIVDIWWTPILPIPQKPKQ